MIQIGVVYDKVSSGIIRIVIPDNPDDLTNGTHPLAVGETQLIVDDTQVQLPITPDSITYLETLIANSQAG